MVWCCRDGRDRMQSHRSGMAGKAPLPLHPGSLKQHWIRPAEVRHRRAHGRQGHAAVLTTLHAWPPHAAAAKAPQSAVQPVAPRGPRIDSTRPTGRRALITEALTDNWCEEHLFILRQAPAMYDDIARHLAECDARWQALLAEREQSPLDLGKASRVGSKRRQEFGVRQALAKWAGVDLTRINGLGVTVVIKRLSEIGPDLSRFASVKHFCSCWGSAWHQDQRRQALGQSRTTRAEDGDHEPFAQRFRAGDLLSSTMCAHGQAARQYRHRPQACPHGVFHADPRRGLRRTGSSATTNSRGSAL